MLYVSRRLPGEQLFGVVDTDDGIESTVSYQDLIEIVVDSGIDIAGVTRSKDAVHAVIVNVWQEPSRVTSIQAKYRALYDTNICVFRDELVGVSIGPRAPSNLVVNVSDFAHKLSGVIQLICDSRRRMGFSLTLVLDDSVELAHCSPPVGLFGLKIDIRNVTNSAVVDSCYSELLKELPGDYNTWYQYLVDRLGRGMDWFCAARISQYLNDVEIGNIRKDYNIPKMSKRLEVILSKEFEMLGSAYATFSDLGRFMKNSTYRTLINSMHRSGILLEASKSDDFEWLKQAFIGAMLYWLLGMFKAPVAYRLYNFINYFECSDRVKSIYIRACNRFASDVLSHMSW